jgi:hypothetical protein
MKRNGYYRSGQAARVWAISSHLVRRLCAAGLIEAERTNSGQWKIPHSEVERIKKEGIPEIPSSIAKDVCENEERDAIPPENRESPLYSHRLVTNAHECAAANNDLREQRIDRDRAIRTWFGDCQTGEASALSLTRAVPPVGSAHVQAHQGRIAWHDSWMSTALHSLPQEAPAELRLLVRDTVSEVLEKLGPEHSSLVVEPLVNAAVAKVLRPWNLERETARAIEGACNLLPYSATNPLSPTVWQSRAHEAAAAAIKKLPADSTFSKKLDASRTAVRQITSEFEDDELRKRILRQANLTDVAPEGHENAKEAIRRRLESLPMGTHALAMEKAREQALAPFREAKKKKERVDRALGRIRGYLERLYWAGETDFESDWAVCNFAKRLEGRLRPVVDEELRNDDLSDDELSDLIEELVDEELE